MEEAKINFLKQNNIDVDAGIKNTLDFVTYNEILLDFYNSLSEIINKLNSYKNNSDMTNYAIDVHALKSNARTLGFMSLGEICYQHEIESKNNNIEYINSEFNNLVSAVQKNYQIIKSYLAL